MAGQLPRHAPHGVHGARVRATRPQRGQQVGVAEEGVAGHHGALRNVTVIFYLTARSAQRDPHGIMGTGIPKKFSYLRPRRTSNTLPTTTPGHLI